MWRTPGVCKVADPPEHECVGFNSETRSRALYAPVEPTPPTPPLPPPPQRLPSLPVGLVLIIVCLIIYQFE